MSDSTASQLLSYKPAKAAEPVTDAKAAGPAHPSKKPQPLPKHVQGSALVAAPISQRLVEFSRGAVGLGAVEVGGRKQDELVIRNVGHEDDIADVSVAIDGPDRSAFSLVPNAAINFDGQAAQFRGGQHAAVSVVAKPLQLGQHAATLVWQVHSRTPSHGPDYVVETVVTATARENGYEAADNEKYRAIAKQQGEQEALRRKAIGDVPLRGISENSLSAQASFVGVVMATADWRTHAVSNLQHDLASKDDMSWSEHAGWAAVTFALTQGCKTMAAVGAGVFGGTRLEAVAKVAFSKASDIFTSGLVRPAHPTCDSAAFFQAQFNALAHAKDAAIDALVVLDVIALSAQDPAERNDAVARVLRGLQAQRDGAAEVQYLASLKAWSLLQAGGSSYSGENSANYDPNPLRGRAGKLLVKVCAFETPDAPLQLARAAWGTNQRVTMALRSGVSGNASGKPNSTPQTATLHAAATVGEINPILRIEFAAKDRFGIERDHVIEKFPDDHSPVFGSETGVWLADRCERLYAGAATVVGACELVHAVQAVSLQALLQGSL